MSSPQRILITRMSAIGDSILTLPVACALRDRFPDAYIAWAIERKSSSVVANHKALNKVILLERGWFGSPWKVWQLRKELRAERFDTVIDCQSVTKSALLGWLSGAPVRIGCKGQYGAELSPWLNNRLVLPEHTHLTDRSLDLLAPLGITKPKIRWDFPLVDVACEEVQKWMQAGTLPQQFAVINPGATWDSKLWEMDRFAAVANYLHRQHGLPTVVVWGGAREKSWAEEIVAGAPHAAQLAPDTTLPQLAALIARGEVFVSSDTGPLHMAVAVGTPSIGLYGSTRPEDCGPYGDPHVGIQKRYHAGSRTERRNADNSAMKLIQVCDVTPHCDRLLESRSLHKPLATSRSAAA